MIISTVRNIELTLKQDFDEKFIIKMNGTVRWVDKESAEFNSLKWLHNKTRNLSQNERNNFFEGVLLSNAKDCETLRTTLNTLFDEGFTNAEPETETVVEELPKEIKLEQTLEKLMNFFKEFEFEPNYRFVNTLTLKAIKSQKEAINYITSYFNLMDNMYQVEIASKCKSKEFTSILSSLKTDATPTKQVNTRFAIYYGSAGTGKTTQAMEESEGRCVVCNSSMLPSDLMEDFVFEEGKPTFQKSSLWNCMEQGKPIVLDEINLLPFDSLRFLQGILDGKKEVDYKGNKISIQDGFKVIGTMNLSIGGMVYGLPEPLVDRCAEIKQFSLTAKQLVNALL